MQGYPPQHQQYLQQQALPSPLTDKDTIIVRR
jgi:hypothetical protein